MQKGMTQQIFVFIFALIMMALILVFGFKQFSVVTSTAGKVETLTFLDDLDKEVQTYYNFDVGSSKFLKLSLPSSVDQVCFFNHDLPLDSLSNPVFFALLQSDKKNNVFLFPLETFQNPGPGFFIPHLLLRGDKNPLCFLTNGKLSVFLETISLGDSVAVEVRAR